MFIDRARIFIAAGQGGAGCVSFRREKFVPYGGPDGGNGGKGGDVYLVADPHFTTLLDLSCKPHYKAHDGSTGENSNKYGRGAEDLTIKLPVGTVVFKDGEMLVDFRIPGQTILIAKGGRGGRGNSAFKTGRHSAPRIAEKGEPGEEITLDLELRLIADIGLAGFPNAGKSTFLSRISSARPKIADYPFTTLSPNLGVMKLGDQNFVVADIPGLIEGAHEGKGLGDDFLRHVQRTKIIIHVIDLFGFDGNTAYANYRTIRNELTKHSKILARKPEIIAANKTDLTGSDEKLAQLRKRLKGKKIYAMSAVSGDGTLDLIKAAVKLLKTTKEEDNIESVPVKKYIYEPEFMVEKEGKVFVVRGKKAEKLAAMTNFGQEESFVRFQNILKKMGIKKALLEKGVTPGDRVRMGKQEFKYER